MTVAGWAAYTLSVLAAAQVAELNVWLVIPVLAAGVLVRLATLVIAIRTVARATGAVELLQQVLPDEAADDDRDRSLVQLLSLTLLPFLGIYAAFGYVQQFASDLVVLSELSLGFGGLLSELNPVNSTTAAAVVIAVIVVLYVLRRILDAVFDRRGLWLVGGLAVFIEATLLLVVALSGFRLFEQFTLWWHDRALVQWWNDGIGLLTGWLHWDLPAFLRIAWSVFSGVFWPVLWDVVSKPIAWLALTTLVVGSRVRSLAELWSTGTVAVDGADRAGRIHARLAGATRLRRVVLRVQEAAFGDLDDKYLPAWQALRLVLKAGWVHLGVFILAYGLVGLAGQWLSTGVLRLIGGVPVSMGLMTAPLVNLIPDVAVMSLQISLLVSTVTRILRHRAHLDRAPEPVVRGLRSRLAEIALVVSVILVFTGVWMARPSDAAASREVPMGRDARLDAELVRVDAVDYGSRLVVGSDTQVSTSAAFVVVHFTCYRPGADGETPHLELINGERRYQSGGWGATALLPQPGFESSTDVVFEVAQADLNSGLRAQITPGAPVTAFHDEVVIALHISDDAASHVGERSVTAAEFSQGRAR
jgi:hypothetical protein